MKKRYLITVTGRVHGVGFRYQAKSLASNLGINGFVKNMPEQAVQIDVEGEENKLVEFIAWCKQGSQLAFVSNCSFMEVNPLGYTEFEIIY